MDTGTVKKGGGRRVRGAIVVFFVFTITSITFGQTSPHGDKLKIDCAYCHTTSDWTTMAKDMKFNHDEETSFKLVGQHSDVACQSCHKSLVFSDVKKDCNSCHKDVHQNSVGPNCDRCHTPAAWIISNPVKMHQETRFPLAGVHQNVDCASCHTQYANLNFPPMDISCFSCHSKQYYSTTSPNHVQAGYSTNCTDCHGVVDVAWQSTNLDHSFFPLVGGHAIQNCFACHTQTSKATGNFKGLSTDCNSCHQADYAHTTFPNHPQLKLSTQCQSCHNINGWMPATFDHSLTGFPLTGSHMALNCTSCHKTTNAVVSPDCYSCHTNDYNTAITPANHPSAGLPHTCADCHNTTTFTNSTFDHTTTGFALTGAHVSTSCQSCHKGTVIGAAADCYSCHSADFASTTNPNHNAQGISHQCDQCHNTSAWTGATNFDHTAAGFPLSGQHASLQCVQCHTNGYATAPSTDCYSCHSNDYTTATTPVNHTAAGLPHTCTDCHTITVPFTTSTFNHTTAGFALTGAHVSTSCQSCHKGTVASTPTDCYSCHSADFASATNPNHVTQGFSHSCDQCHTTTNWTSAGFDHTAAGFPLTGGHASVQCAQCHTSGYATAPSTACVSCHQTNFNSTTNPSHVTLALPTNCTTCHTLNPGWTPATFPVHSTYYVITGAHTSLTCDQCHNGNYNTAPASCYGCHQNDYNTTNNPPHQSAGYPTDCTQCHTQTAWSPSTFTHTQFPITSGNHASPPLLCSQCHTTISNFSIYSCTTSGCHPQASTDPHHTEVRNYVYSPTSCYTCHATGRAG